MEMSIAKLATAQKAAEINTAVGVAVLKQAQDAAGAEALALLQSIPQTPSSSSSAGGLGDVVDIAV
ncbi:MAG: putative motility protein [Fibromonadales bacterium]|nr:putative motility protein [Fibromonadales bacterium]